MNTSKRPRGRQVATNPLLNTTIRLNKEQKAFVKEKGSKFVRALIVAAMKAELEGANHETN